MDQGSTKKRSAVHNFVPTVTKFCVMWEGLSLPHDTKFGNSRCEIVGRRMIFIWSLIHGSSWSGLIKLGPGHSSTWWRLDLRSLFLAYITRYQHISRTLGAVHAHIQPHANAMTPGRWLSLMIPSWWWIMSSPPTRVGAQQGSKCSNCMIVVWPCSGA